MAAPWAGIPFGWMYEEDAVGGTALYRSAVNGATVREKPTLLAEVVAQRAAKARASLALLRQQEDTKRKDKDKNSSVSMSATRRAITLPPPPPKLELKPDTNNKLNAKEVEVEEEDKKIKALTVAAVALDATREHASLERATLSYDLLRIGGLAQLLNELGLTERYATAFTEAGYNDEKLLQVALAIDEDREGDGVEEFERMVSACGIRGGSVVVLRRRLLEFDVKSTHKKKAAIGGGSGGGGKKGTAAEQKKLLKKKKKKTKEDLSELGL
jgi:hypothetical protein